MTIREWEFGYTRVGALLYESVSMIIREWGACLDDNVSMGRREWEHDYTRVGT